VVAVTLSSKMGQPAFSGVLLCVPPYRAARERLYERIRVRGDVHALGVVVGSCRLLTMIIT
jgi:hypothetical protein